MAFSRILVLARIFCIAAANTPGAGRPNVLFIAVHDLRPELGCYGADCAELEYVPTPDTTGSFGWLRDYGFKV